MMQSEANLSTARRRVLDAVLELQPATLHALSEKLGGHPNSTRQKLDALIETGLIQAEILATGSPGRRPKAYALSESGRILLGAAAPAKEDSMLGAFAAYLLTRDDPKQEAREVGAIWGEKRAALASSEDDPKTALIEVLDSMGFEPTLTDVPEGEALVLRSCPLQGLPGSGGLGVMCELHRSMINGFVQKLGGHSMKLVPYANSDGCIVREEAEEKELST